MPIQNNLSSIKIFFLRFDIKSCWSWPTKFYSFIEKKAFKICPLVNLVEKIWINFKIWFGTLLPLSACSGNSKGLSNVDFLQCLEHQQNKKVEKMLQLLSTHNRFVNVKLCLIFEASNIQKKDPSHVEIKVLPWAFQQKLKEL